MRRHNNPFNGKQYVLNRETHVIHDLDRETPECHIDDIGKKQVFNCDSCSDAIIYSVMTDGIDCKNCTCCMPEEPTT